MEIKNINESILFKDENFTKRVLFVNKDVLCFVLNFKPGQSLAVHKHENSSVIVNVLSGSGQLKVNDETVDITQGSVAYAKGEDDFSIPLVNENLTLYVTISPNPSNEKYSKDFG